MLHTLPSSAQEPPEASNKDRVAMEDSVPATSSHQPTPALLIGRNTMKPTEYMADDNCPQNQAVAVQLGDREETGNVPNLTAEVIDEPPDLSK
ncbi:hypothetical protein AV530_012776 [Patagioenas fasciata monilis]|uniref:Uncharacterized protein n=1 Tax=Patagioenas fasciata monilis TaxID=372326 RepID=A0A1V4JEY1_PATFA|nr:hypothetical protein AV530_012776 [Patagioenas fasciata monilis]